MIQAAVPNEGESVPVHIFERLHDHARRSSGLAGIRSFSLKSLPTCPRSTVGMSSRFSAAVLMDFASRAFAVEILNPDNPLVEDAKWRLADGRGISTQGLILLQCLLVNTRHVIDCEQRVKAPTPPALSWRTVAEPNMEHVSTSCDGEI